MMLRSSIRWVAAVATFMMLLTTIAATTRSNSCDNACDGEFMVCWHVVQTFADVFRCGVNRKSCMKTC